MYTLKITASELEELRAVAPKIAAKAKAVTPPRLVARKSSPIPKATIEAGESWKRWAADMAKDPEMARRAAITLADVVALHRGLPRVDAL